MTNTEAYIRSELDGIAGPPDRGPLCPHCNNHIPQFTDLSDDEAARIRRLGQTTMAIIELRAATGCPAAWAELWIEHRGRPQVIPGETPPCPYCGKPLRTSLAKQCRFCLKDWHLDAT